MDTIDNTEDLINTTHRYNHYCHAVKKDGTKCSLYAPHEGGHLPKHGVEKDRFTDDECV